MNENEKILLVDDEPLVVEGMKRALGHSFRIEIAGGPEDGLNGLEHRGPFAVVVSDLRMPVMNGIEFLAQVKARSPQTVRVMLTGHADLEAAIAAINEGNIFRFLTKPCAPELLRQALEYSLEQYRLVTAEQELLQRTLMGSVTVLTEILSVLYPAAFSRSSRIQHYVRLMANALEIQDVWQVEVAAILSQIGYITLPSGTADKVYAGVDLSDEETRLFARHPIAASKFLAKIPRLERVAQIIAWQQEPYRYNQPRLGPAASDPVLSGAQMLHIAVDLERLVGHGLTLRAALSKMRTAEGEYNSEFLRIIENSREPALDWNERFVRQHELDTSMIAAADIRARNGLVLLAKGEPLSCPALERMHSLASEIGMVEPIHVLVPAQPVVQ